MIAPGSFTVDLVALAAIGFVPEMTGGGIFAFACYLPSGAHVLITGFEGSGMPEFADWLVGIYPPDWDGSPAQYLDPESNPAITLLEAAAAGLRIAGRLGA